MGRSFIIYNYMAACGDLQASLDLKPAHQFVFSVEQLKFFKMSK